MIKRWIVICLLIFVAAIAASAQSAECPADKVCVTREAALKALADADTVKADQVAITGYKQAIEDLRSELNNMRVQFAATTGELTAVKQNAVSDRAIIDLLLKQVRPKKIGLINF